jgi:Uma2 family endonuclease
VRRRNTVCDGLPAGLDVQILSVLGGMLDDMAADPTVDLRRRFTVEEYERMGEVGIFDPDDRVELLDGEIVFISPIGPKHAGVVNWLCARLWSVVTDRATVIPQNPVRLLPRSEPQPDVTVARARRDFYRSAHPTSEDILLVIEVADSSIKTDRAVKVPIYARQGIVEVADRPCGGRGARVLRPP